jgi:hypothetical protein
MASLSGPHPISAQYQVKIPVKLARDLHLRAGDEFFWRRSDDDPDVLFLIPAEVVERRYAAGEQSVTPILGLAASTPGWRSKATPWSASPRKSAPACPPPRNAAGWRCRLGCRCSGWSSEIGTPIDPDNFSHAFSRLCESAGLGHWHPHELRHSGASLMLAQGTPLHVVSEILGHASIAITKDVYGHLVEGDKRAAAQSMSGLLFGTGTGRRGSQRGSQGRKKSPSRTVEGPVSWRARRDSNPQPSDP